MTATGHDGGLYVVLQAGCFKSGNLTNKLYPLPLVFELCEDQTFQHAASYKLASNRSNRINVERTSRWSQWSGGLRRQVTPADFILSISASSISVNPIELSRAS